MKRKKGFTLMEMLIVVAIIVILVAVSIPVFSSMLKKVKKTTCDANLRSAKGVLTFAYMTEGMLDDKIGELMINNMGAKPSGEGWSGLCPEEGVYTVNPVGGSFTITCSKHGMTTVDTLTKTPEDITALAEAMFHADTKLGNILNKYFYDENGKKIRSSLDSTGSNWGVEMKEKIAAQFHVNANEFDFRIYYNNNECKLYLSDSLATAKAGDKVDCKGYEIKLTMVGTPPNATVQCGMGKSIEGSVTVEMEEIDRANGEKVIYPVLAARELDWTNAK